MLLVLFSDPEICPGFVMASSVGYVLFRETEQDHDLHSDLLFHNTSLSAFSRSYKGAITKVTLYQKYAAYCRCALDLSLQLWKELNFGVAGLARLSARNLM